MPRGRRWGVGAQPRCVTGLGSRPVADVRRRIGLSLGADLCWPICYEEIIRRLDLAIPLGDDTIRFDVDRVTIEPFDLRQPSSYDVVVDRLTHWYTTSREWIKKAVLMDGLYVFNNPWAIQSMEKHTSYCAMMRLGMPIPETWIVPPKDYEFKPDLAITLSRYARLFDLDEVGRSVGYPLFAKPYDGGGWAGVSRVDDDAALHRATTPAAPTCCTCNEPSSHTISSCAASGSDRRPGSCATTRLHRCTTGTRWTTATSRTTSARRSSTRR